MSQRPTLRIRVHARTIHEAQGVGLGVAADGGIVVPVPVVMQAGILLGASDAHTASAPRSGTTFNIGLPNVDQATCPGKRRLLASAPDSDWTPRFSWRCRFTPSQIDARATGARGFHSACQTITLLHYIRCASSNIRSISSRAAAFAI